MMGAVDTSPPRCPVCNATGRATDHVEVWNGPFTDRIPSEHVCPNGHQPGTPVWVGALRARAAGWVVEPGPDGGFTASLPVGVGPVEAS